MRSGFVTMYVRRLPRSNCRGVKKGGTGGFKVWILLEDRILGEKCLIAASHDESA